MTILRRLTAAAPRRVRVGSALEGSGLESKRQCLSSVIQDPEIFCEICKDVFTKPVKLPGCGHRFCRRCVDASSSKCNPFRCFLCGVPCHKTDAVEDTSIFCSLDDSQLERIVDHFVLRNAIDEERNDMDHVLERFHRFLPLFDNLDAAKAVLQQRRDSVHQRRKKYAKRLVVEFLRRLYDRQQRELIDSMNALNLIRRDLAAKTDVKAVRSTFDFPSDLSLSKFHVVTEVQSPEEAHLVDQLPPTPAFPDPTFRPISDRHSAIMNSLLDTFGKKYISGCAGDEDYLENFLARTFKYTEVQPIATIGYSRPPGGHTGGNSLVSAVQIDKDGEYFVVASRDTPMKLYSLESVLANRGNPPCVASFPVLKGSSKVSNVSWNHHVKHYMANSNYEGLIHVWDTSKLKVIRQFSEHEQRCWSVQFNTVLPEIMASGSDDRTVKIWSLNDSRSISTIKANMHVVCVNFNPQRQEQLLFGGTDHNIYLYDLRKLSAPVSVMRDHRKCVSYVKYLNTKEIVSASTDQTLKIWNIDTAQPTSTLSGHANEKNFVGLATNGEHVVCGSETNEVFVYYKDCPVPTARYDFLSKIEPWSMKPCREFGGGYVSALCWRKDSDIIIAANSQGAARVLQITDHARHDDI